MCDQRNEWFATETMTHRSVWNACILVHVEEQNQSWSLLVAGVLCMEMPSSTALLGSCQSDTLARHLCLMFSEIIGDIFLSGKSLSRHTA